jgi:lipopolysaccharide transport system ATP-binding protein
VTFLSNPAVHVENLSKRYRIGAREQGYRTLREAIVDAVKAPINNLRNLRSLTKFSGNDDEEDVIWALRDINFDVEQGEVVGIIGPNGAGKSTLLKVLSRITEPTTGFAEIRGRVSSLLEVGTGFHPELTGRENIYLNGTVLGMSKKEIDRKFDEIVDFAGVEKFIDTPVKRYSSGMQVRLAFAVAAHLEPEILVVDEVLSVGDAAFQKKCLGKMGEVAKGGRTILFVSHNMAAVSNLCSKAMLLEKGRIILNDQTEDVIDNYIFRLASSTPALLSSRKDRFGDGRLRFTDTWVENEKGERVSCVKSGESIKIAASYEVRNGATVSNLTVAFAISNVENIQLTDLSNATSGDYFDGEIPSKGIFKCCIPKLPLNTGLYFYNVIARSGGAIEDWVRQAGRFEVESSDYFSTGRVVDPAHGIFLIDQKWYLESG